MSNKFQKKTSLRQVRHFSESIRKQVVRDIEDGKCTVVEAIRETGATGTTIYRWLHCYSRYLKKNQVLIVEEKSEVYRSKQLEERVKELEAALGRKQLALDLLNKVIDLANEAYQTDLKKTLLSQPLSGSGLTGASITATK